MYMYVQGVYEMNEEISKCILCNGYYQKCMTKCKKTM